MLKIDVLAAPEMASSILYGLYDVLMSPGAAWPRVVLGKPAAPLFDVQIVARRKSQFMCRGGVPVSPAATLADATDADIICVPNMAIPIDQCPYGLFPDEVAWLRSRYQSGATIATVCSGAVLLAEAGFLAGEETTSHWAYEKTFRKYYTDVKFCPDRILTFAGAGDRLVMAGGMSSWQDLALYLISRFLGPEHAVQASKFYVISDRTDGQLPYAAMSQRIQADDQAIKQCQTWLRDNYQSANVVATMQDLSGLTRRTFSRRFRTATGYTPIDYVQAVRIEEAKQFLESTKTSVEEIGATVGYQDERAFRRIFRKRTGLSPSAYRRRFNHSRFTQSQSPC